MKRLKLLLVVLTITNQLFAGTLKIINETEKELVKKTNIKKEGSQNIKDNDQEPNERATDSSTTSAAAK